MNYHSFQRKRLAADTNGKATPVPLWSVTPMQLSHHSGDKPLGCFSQEFHLPQSSDSTLADLGTNCSMSSEMRRKLANSLYMSRSGDSRHSPKGPDSGNQGKFWHCSGSDFLCLGQLFTTERFSNFS